MGTSSVCSLRWGLSDGGTFLPRRFCSASMAKSNRSRSRSSGRLIALARSLGKICRADEVGFGDEEGSSGNEAPP